jgi:hypothetical protein
LQKKQDVPAEQVLATADALAITSDHLSNDVTKFPGRVRAD